MAEINSKPGHTVGVDVGGTKIMASVFNPAFQRRGRIKLSTKPERGPARVMQRIAQAIRDAVDEADLQMKDIRAVGIGAPGTVDGEEGNVIFAPNLGWRNIPLRKELEKLLEVSVFVENDCNIAALGVHVVELNSKPRNMLGIFLGTGIGGGLIIDGALHQGFRNAAGEIGHMVLDVKGPKCGCGNNGCLEALASRTAIFQRIQSAVKQGKKTVLTEMLGADFSQMRSSHLRKALHRGDELVDQLVRSAAEYTGIAVGNLVNILNPEVVVLGGGLMEALACEMLATISKVARDHAMPGAMKGVEIKSSCLGDYAGITGGAVLARQMAK